MNTYEYTTHEGWNNDEQILVTRTITTEVPFASHVVRVSAHNGDIVERAYDSREGAKNGLAYYLRKFDKINVGASGTFYDLVSVN